VASAEILRRPCAQEKPGLGGRRRRGNDGRIHNGPRLQQQLLVLQQLADFAKQRRGQSMLFQQVAKAQDRHFIRHQVSRQLNPR